MGAESGTKSEAPDKSEEDGVSDLLKQHLPVWGVDTVSMLHPKEEPVSVPDKDLDPPVGDDCFECLEEEVGSNSAAEETAEAEGGYEGTCPRHRAQEAARLAAERED